jgi:hypothetical protein
MIQASSPRPEPARRRRARRRTPVCFVLTTALALLFSGCYVKNAYTMIGQARDEIFRVEGLQMDPDAQYHVEAAKGLLAAAEKQYEEADFTSAYRFAQGAHEQVDRALGLQSLHQTAASSESRGDQ